MNLDSDAIFDSFVEVIHQIANGLPPNFYCETLANPVHTVRHARTKYQKLL
jgi:hypothetical protein